MVPDEGRFRKTHSEEQREKRFEQGVDERNPGPKPLAHDAQAFELLGENAFGHRAFREAQHVGWAFYRLDTFWRCEPIVVHNLADVPVASFIKCKLADSIVL